MIPLLFVLLALLAFLLTGITFIQVLYLESLRIRTRGLAALVFFKEVVQEKLGLKSERGALAFSLIKHGLIAIIGVVAFGITSLRNRSHSLALFEALLMSLLVMLGAAYVIPQVLYRKTEARWLLPLVPAFRAFSLLAAPVAAVLRFFQTVVDLGDPEPESGEPNSSEEHIEALISAGTQEGIIEEEDRELIQAAVAFGDKTVREVVTPRPRIVAIEASRTLEELRDLAINEQYSRIPVYEGTIDNIIGFIHVRDLFELDQEERNRRTIRDLLRPVRFVPESKPASDLVKEMQSDRAHMVIVVDEYGNTAGLATLEDVVEEIIGEIRDEHEPELDATPDGSGAFVVSGSCDVDRLRDLLEYSPPEETESTTVSGLVTEWFGHVPAVGEVIEREGIRIEVLAADERRVEQVRVGRVPESAHG